MDHSAPPTSAGQPCPSLPSAKPELSSSKQQQPPPPPQQRPKKDTTLAEVKRGVSLNLPSLPMDSAESLVRCGAPGSALGPSRVKSLTKPLTSAGRQELPICYDFVQGKCRRLNCRYQHDFGAVIRHNARESRVCFDHLRGECTRGSLCRFSHDIRRLVLQGMEEAATQQTLTEPTANGICYDFCRGACPRKGKCPWTHNLIEIAWNTSKQPLLDSQKFSICRKVLNAIKNTCPQDLAERAIHRMITQPSLQLKILSLNFVDESSHPLRPDVLSATTSPDSFSVNHPCFFTGLDLSGDIQRNDRSQFKFIGDSLFDEGPRRV